MVVWHAPAGLLSNANLSDGAYDWMRVLKYHMEIRTVLQAKTDVPEFRDDMAIQTTVVETESGEKERRTSVVKPVAGHLLGTSCYSIISCAVVR